jgi:Uma2 family endonuclease
MATAPLPVNRPATYDDIVALPDHLVGEILDGELIVSPRPAPRHALAGSGLGALLMGPYQFGIGGPGGWWILDEPELHLGRAVAVPDLAGWRRERLPALPETAWFAVAPDWVCEVLSPSTERVDRTRKLGVYRREGVGHVWLVNPLARTLEVLRLEGDLYALLAVHAAAERVRAEPFEGLELDLSLLWPDAEPDAPAPTETESAPARD